MNADTNEPSAAPKSRRDNKPFFADWARKLHADDSLTPGLRQVYRRTLEGFLQFCQQRQAGPSVALARAYVELTQLERAPSPAQLQELLTLTLSSNEEEREWGRGAHTPGSDILIPVEY